MDEKKKPEEKKKPLSRGERRKRNQKYMILLVSAVMLFSGIYFGVNQTTTTVKGGASSYSDRLLEYQVYPIGNYSVPVKIDGRVDQMIVMFRSASSITQETLDSVLGDNISGVKKTTFEMSGTYAFFRFEVDNMTKAVQAVKNLIRTRDYILYSVYAGNTSVGRVSVIGNDIVPGKYAKVLLFQRVLSGVYDVIGFSQGMVEFIGDLKGNVTNVTGFVYQGVLKSRIDSSQLNKTLVNVSDLRVNEPVLVIEAENYSLDLPNVTVSYEGNKTFVESENFTAIAEVLNSKNVSHQVVFGTISFGTGLGPDDLALRSFLNVSGVVNVSRSMIGLTSIPREVTDGTRIVVVPNYREVYTVLNESAKVGDQIELGLTTISLGDVTLVIANQV